jgi:hypothetical protein
MFALLARLLGTAARASAAKKFARALGPRLLQDYGASEFYTPAQIRAACVHCRLPTKHIAIGYAAFLPEAAFNALGQEDDYATLRAMFTAHIPAPAYSEVSPAPEIHFSSQQM